MTRDVLPAAAERVLVLRALGLGDLLTAVPALRGLRRQYPDARITLAAPGQYRDLAVLTGAVDDLLPTRGLGDITVREPFDLAVNLHGRGPQSIEHLRALGAGAILTHRHPDFRDLAGPPWRSDVHDVQRWCDLLQWAGIGCHPGDLSIPRPPGRPDRSGVVVIHPGASAGARRWPAERFAQVAAAVRDAGHQVVITGSAAERSLADRVARAAGLPAGAVLAGDLDLLDLVALIGDARLVLCGDTGVGHLMTATGTPSVLLFGPTPPSQWGPPAEPKHVVLWAGNRGDPHADRPDSGLLLLTVERVLGATTALLASCA